jgi:hypothetical protein
MAFKILIVFFLKIDMANKFNKFWKSKNDNLCSTHVLQ